MATAYPSGFDIVALRADEFDRPVAAFFNAILQGPRAMEVELGTDPASLGSAWSTYTDIADLVARLSAVEVGKFSLEYPTDAPAEIHFQHPERFSDSTKIIVYPFLIATGKGRRLGQDFRVNTRIIVDTGAPVGFEVWRRTMSTKSSGTEDFYYLAWEDKL